MQTDRMENGVKDPGKNTAKRTWHTPELRKNTILDNTQLYNGVGVDGSVEGTSLG